MTEDSLVDQEITDNDKTMGLLCYLIGVLVPLVVLLSETGKVRAFQRYHAIQSLGLSAVWLVFGLILCVPFCALEAVSAVGGLLGWIGGMAVGNLLAPIFVQANSPVVWNPWLALGAMGAAILVGQLSSLYPAIRAARLDPCTALRSL